MMEVTHLYRRTPSAADYKATKYGSTWNKRAPGAVSRLESSSQAPLSSAVRSSLEVSHQKIRTGDYTKRCSTTVLCCLGEAAKQNVSGGSTLRGSKLIVSPLPLH